MPRGHEAAFEEATDAVLMAVAERLRDTMRRLDEVLVTPPYTLLLHTAPVEVSRRVVLDGVPADSATPGSKAAFHWHLEVIPRLLPVAGLAWDGGIHINPVPPEEAAQALRDAKP